MKSLFSSIFRSDAEENKLNFIADIKKYLTEHPVNAFGIYPETMVKTDLNNESNIYPFILSRDKAKGSEVFLTLLMGANEKEKIDAYLLKYESNVKKKSDIPCLVIPKVNPKADYVFTPTLTGCSVIIEDGGENLYVYHDPRPYEADVNNVSVEGVKHEYSNVMFAFECGEMEYKEHHLSNSETLGFAMLFFNKVIGQWTFLGQALRFGELDKRHSIQHFEMNNQVSNPIEVVLDNECSRLNDTFRAI